MPKKVEPPVNVCMPELTPDDRLQYMIDNCMKQETRPYYKPLSRQEVNQKRTEFVDNCGEINLLEIDLSAIKKEFKGKIDPIKAVNACLMTEINTKQKQVTGRIFHMQDWESFEIITYDEMGIEISRRKMYPDERQKMASFGAHLRKVSNGESSITDIEPVDDDNDE